MSKLQEELGIKKRELMNSSFFDGCLQQRSADRTGKIKMDNRKRTKFPVRTILLMFRLKFFESGQET